MEERHENEQYFFVSSTIDELATFLSRYQSPCCVCAPMLGQELAARGAEVAILDIDERFAALPGFATFDLNQPHWIDSKFDVIVCDPPFFNVSLHRLFTALRLLSHHDFQQPLLVSYLTRRTKSVLDAFDSFNLRPTDYFPKYATVEENERNRIEFFSNIDLEALVAR